MMSKSEVVDPPINAGTSKQSNNNEKAFNKPHQAKEWEINAIGDFLLRLYKNRIISKYNDWDVSKSIVRQEFLKFLKIAENANLEKMFIESYGSADIGKLLFRTRFLINTPRGSQHYRIRNLNLYQYRDQKLEQLDKRRKIALGDSGIGNSENDRKSVLNASPNDDEEGEQNFLIYQGSELQVRKSDFSPDKLSCWVCQLNFNDKFELEEHIVFHSEESNFELLGQLKKFDSALFTISYKPGNDSHSLCFTLKTKLQNVVIEKVILVQSRSFHYINDMRVPYEINGADKFYIDARLFREFIEQPIIILFRAYSEDMRFMEQHHFVRYQPFPLAHLHLNSKHLSDESYFEPAMSLPAFNVDDSLIKAWQSDFPKEYLMKISPEFYEYIAENKKISIPNMCAVFKIFLQMEDLALRRACYLLLQREVKLRMTGEIYSLKLKYLWWSSEIVGGNLQQLPEANDEVILVQESVETFALKNCDIFKVLLEKGLDSLLLLHYEVGKTFIGRIKRAERGRILFMCEENIPLDKSYIVFFRPSRFYLRHQRRALEQLNCLSIVDLSDFLFPLENITSFALPTMNLALQNEDIKNDESQLRAVRNIICDRKLGAPFIITGGPGTGKTAVIVESILQLYLRQPKSKILVITGTDSACDEIAMRLCKVLCKMHDPQAIARIYESVGEQRRDKIDKLLLQHSNLYGDKFVIPSVKILHEFRILICTTKLICRLSGGNFGKYTNGESVYSHVFMDDAASITEPEALVTVIYTLTRNSKLILAGDTQQLNPLLYSARASDLGLNVSLMERLLLRNCFRTDATGHYNRSILTKLVHNYRAHPKIVDLYNHLFYDNKLISMAPNGIVSSYIGWHRLPNPDYPIIFHEITASHDINEDMNDSSQCTFNAKEIAVILNYVKDLMYIGVNGRKIEQTEIGIISAYKKQASYIQDELNLRGWYNIEVVLPEDFQGKEKAIVIVSFVWTLPTSLDILNNPRLLNFMISRPRSLLILIGSSKVLNQSKCLKYIIGECRKNKSLEFESMCWEDLKSSKTLNDWNVNENVIDGMDDAKSECSEVSAAGVETKIPNTNRKNRYRKHKNKSNVTGNNANDTAKNDLHAKNKIDDLLGSLPKAPVHALNADEAEIKERLKKLNLNSMPSTSKAASAAEPKTSPAATSNSQTNEKKDNKIDTKQQQQKPKQNKNTPGQGHVKRLNNNVGQQHTKCNVQAYKKTYTDNENNHQKEKNKAGNVQLKHQTQMQQSQNKPKNEQEKKNDLKMHATDSGQQPKTASSSFFHPLQQHQQPTPSAPPPSYEQSVSPPFMQPQQMASYPRQQLYPMVPPYPNPYGTDTVPIRSPPEQQQPQRPTRNIQHYGVQQQQQNNKKKDNSPNCVIA